MNPLPALPIDLPPLPIDTFPNIMGFIRGGLRSDWKSYSLVSRTFIQDYLTWTTGAVRKILSNKMNLDGEALDSYLDGKVRHLEESLERNGAPEGVRTSIRAIFFDEFLSRLQTLQHRTHFRKKLVPPKPLEPPSPPEISPLSQTDQDSEFFLASIKNDYPKMRTAYSTIYANKAMNAKEKLEVLREWMKENRDLFQDTTTLEIPGAHHYYKLHSFPKELEYFTKLEKLELDNHQIASFKHMPEFPCLRRLWLENNCIGSFKHMPLFPLLEYLYLRGNCIERFEHLPVLRHLEGLWLDGNCIEGFEHMTVLPRLKYLGLVDNCITNFQHMPSLPELILFYLNDNLIADCELMPELPKLKSLYVSKNFILNPRFPRQFYDEGRLSFEVYGLSFKNGLQKSS